MRLKNSFITVLLLWFTFLFPMNLKKNKHQYTSILFKYRNNFHDENRFTAGASRLVNNFCLLDMEIMYYQWIKKDNYNQNKNNASLFSIVDIGSSFLIDKIYPDFDSTNAFALSPIQLTNSTYNFVVLGDPNYDPFNPKKSFSTAIYVKNNTNFYCFRQNKWFEIVPGAGLKTYYGFLAIDIGYEKKIQYVLKKESKYIDSIYFTINFYINSF